MRNISRRSAAYGGTSTIMTIGATLIGLSASVFAIDMPAYFDARNQLQTAVDAGALAGAANLPVSQAQAQQAAYEFASQNLVMGKKLQPSELSYTSSKSKFGVTAQTDVPTIMGKALCALAGRKIDGTGGGTGGSSDCSTMHVVASSAAEPAARDTVLVIDTSSSMDDLGNGRPLKDVKSAAIKYIDTILSMNSNSVDRIALVTFNQTGTLKIALTSQSQSPGYASIKNAINSITLFNGVGWNTNYEAGLHKALDEIQANGRQNANKNIIFMTDGMPNLPAPSNYYSYNNSEPYRKCTDSVNSSSQVKALCVTKNGQKVCPTLPNTQITTNMISATNFQCGTDYVNTMQSLTNGQTDRAKALDTTVNTIVINDGTNDDNATEILRRLIKNEAWAPTQINYMASTTKGQQYEALNYDATKISQIYQTIAQDIHIKLSAK